MTGLRRVVHARYTSTAAVAAHRAAPAAIRAICQPGIPPMTTVWTPYNGTTTCPGGSGGCPIHGPVGDVMPMGVELSAPSRGVLAWAVLRELGRAGVAARVERHVGFARHLAQRARQHPRLELLLEPELSVVCFRYAASDAVNAEILLRLRRTTRSIPSSTVVGGHLAIRPCFINPHTRLADVDALVDHVTTIGDELTGTQSG